MAALRPDKRQRPEINATQVVAEVTSAFLRYEQALTGNDVAELDRLFWANPHTVRYTAAENLHGYDAIRAFRAARRILEHLGRWAPEPAERRWPIKLKRCSKRPGAAVAS